LIDITYQKAACISIISNSVSNITTANLLLQSILYCYLKVSLLEQHCKDTCHLMLDLMLKLTVQRAVCDSGNSSFENCAFSLNVL